MGSVNLRFTRQGTFGAVWKYVSFHARRNVGATCSFVFLKWMFHFYSEARLGYSFPKKIGGGVPGIKRNSKGVGNNSFDCSVVSAREKTNDVWQLALYTTFFLWPMALGLYNASYIYCLPRTTAGSTFSSFLDHDRRVLRPFKRSPKSLLTWQPSFSRFAQFFGKLQCLWQLSTLAVTKCRRFQIPQKLSVKILWRLA